MVQLLRRISPLVIHALNAQIKSGNPTTSKNISSSNKSMSITLDVSNKATHPTPLALPSKGETIDYTIVQDLKRARANISIYELAKIAGQREFLVQTFSQPSPSDKASVSQKVSGKFSCSIKFEVNVTTFNTNTLCPPFLLTFENFNYNVHNCLVDYGASVNVMPLSIAKKTKVKWDKTNAQIIQLNRSLVQAIGEFRNVLIQLSSDH